MDKILEIYEYVLKEYLSIRFANQQNIDPVELNKERFRVKAVFTAVIFFMNSGFRTSNSKTVFNTNNWLKDSFTDRNLFSIIIEEANEYLIELIDKSLLDLMLNEPIEISIFYESLLSVESGNEGNGTKISIAKNYRNKLGSYYTPIKLANIITEKTIDEFLKLNLKIKKNSITSKLGNQILKECTTIKFVDFSCGGGIFLMEVINYFDNLFNRLKVNNTIKIDLLKKIILNIYAFDVDCIALEVAKLNLLLRIGLPSLYSTLSNNFIHANFLLQSDFPINQSRKIEIFSSGFIYHEELSLTKDQLKKYDVILGNPPWEKIRFEEKKFYALYSNTISENHFKSNRVQEIEEMELINNQLAVYSTEFRLEIEKAKSDLKKNTFFSLSNNGELNTYALFTEASLRLRTSRGVIGLVLKSSIVTSQVNQNIFKYLTNNNLVVAIYDFINRKKIFNIDSRERFCFLLLGNTKNSSFKVNMNLKEPEEIVTGEYAPLELSYDSLRLLNPATGMLPNFSSKQEVDFLLRISFDFPFFKKVYSNVRFGRIVHFTSHAQFISKEHTENNIPIYEGKFFNQFDGKYSGFNNAKYESKYGSKSSSANLEESKKQIPDYFPESRFFIDREKWLQLSKNHKEKFMLAWRSLTSATNTRTCIATILPFIPASQSVQFLTTDENDLLYIAGLFNSIVFDFILKKKLNGIDLTQSVINQISVPNYEHISKQTIFNGKSASIKEHVSLLVSSLLKGDARLDLLFNSVYPNDEISNKSRLDTIRDIDLLFMALYNLTDSEVNMVTYEFKKQYSNDDIIWFKTKLESLFRNNTISPTISASSSHSPIS